MAATDDKTKQPDETRVWTRYPVDAHDPSIEGVPVITQDGVNVPTKHLPEIRASARQAGIQLGEGKAD